jgi:hypothetical protein
MPLDPTLVAALQSLGLPSTDAPRRPVVRSKGNTLVTFGLVQRTGAVEWVGVWIHGRNLDFVGPEPPPSGHAEPQGLSGTSARVVDLVAEAARVYLERVEELDEALAELQLRGDKAALNEIWILQRKTAHLRGHISRALVAAAELSNAHSKEFPNLDKAFPTVSAELERVHGLAEAVRQGLSDLILLRNAERSNELSDMTNELSRTSNRIAALANISNIRMLGITYIALLLALIGAVVLIPNTGATILGMPSAAWVPGIWVDFILIVLAVIPIVVVFTRGWVRILLRGMMGFEGKAAEGVRDLPEISPDAAADESPATGHPPASGSALGRAPRPTSDR